MSNFLGRLCDGSLDCEIIIFPLFVPIAFLCVGFGLLLIRWVLDNPNRYRKLAAFSSYCVAVTISLFLVLLLAGAAVSARANKDARGEKHCELLHENVPLAPPQSSTGLSGSRVAVS